MGSAAKDSQRVWGLGKSQGLGYSGGSGQSLANIDQSDTVSELDVAMDGVLVTHDNKKNADDLTSNCMPYFRHSHTQIPSLGDMDVDQPESDFVSPATQKERLEAFVQEIRIAELMRIKTKRFENRQQAAKKDQNHFLQHDSNKTFRQLHKLLRVSQSPSAAVTLDDIERALAIRRRRS
ncbi:hypothetical protein BGZ83_003842 [Gryganskiella cystojenkinii]|nr:hypothetical protein BGZ83_003842 [Gryganskiella cystojenkinii]